MKRIILIIGIIVWSSSLFAQIKPLSEEKRKEFEAQKVAFFTQEMQLTPEEASKFWPLYNEMQTKIRAEGYKIRNVVGNQKIKELSEKQAHESIDTILDTETKMQAIKKEYYQRIIQVLSAKKLWLMMKAERDFHHQLWKKLDKYPPSKMK